MKKFSFLDQVLIAVDNGMRSLCTQPVASRPNPGTHEEESQLSPEEQKKSVALMRINHTGEVCAQALYFGQAMVAKSTATKQALQKSAEEETDHLAWCQERIQELNGRVSYLNPLWYFGSFSIGLLAGMLADKWSLGFVVATERQVGEHLESHLRQLSPLDRKSSRILEQMCQDEAYHATVALGAGAHELPTIIKKMMRVCSKIMTTTTYYL